jgi:hypothetical protein
MNNQCLAHLEHPGKDTAGLYYQGITYSTQSTSRTLPALLSQFVLLNFIHMYIAMEGVAVTSMLHVAFLGVLLGMVVS